MSQPPPTPEPPEEWRAFERVLQQLLRLPPPPPPCRGPPPPSWPPRPGQEGARTGVKFGIIPSSEGCRVSGGGGLSPDCGDAGSGIQVVVFFLKAVPCKYAP